MKLFGAGFTLTEVANALHTPQPGVSRPIRELEDELGIELSIRAGKRLTGMTEPGAQVLPIIERLLADADNLRNAARDFSQHDADPLPIAAIHSQALMPCLRRCAISASSIPRSR